MPIPIIAVIVIPIFLRLVYVSPFEFQEEEEEVSVISEESNPNILYFMLFGIWAIFLVRILIRIRKRQFRFAQKY